MNTEEKYPKDFQEFLAEFKDEEACRRYLFDMRRPNSFICPKNARMKQSIGSHHKT